MKKRLICLVLCLVLALALAAPAMASGGYWENRDGRWYYTNSLGEPCVGRHKINGVWYFFETSSYNSEFYYSEMVYDTWRTDFLTEEMYYFSSSGAMATGWFKDQNGHWCYCKSDGAAYNGWLKSGGKWYYIDQGYMLYGGTHELPDGSKHKFSSSGVWNGEVGGTSTQVQTGWYSINGKWFYGLSNGSNATNWKKISGVWYYFEPNANSSDNQLGEMYANEWIRAMQHVYYFKSNGAMATGWFQNGCVSDETYGDWFYAKSDGSMYSGWLKSGGKWYYLDGGHMLYGGTRELPDGSWHIFSNSGVWQGELNRDPSLSDETEASVLAAFKSLLAGKSSSWRFAVKDLNNDGLPELLAGYAETSGDGVNVMEDINVYYYNGYTDSVKTAFTIENTYLDAYLHPNVYWTAKGYLLDYGHGTGGAVSYTYYRWNGSYYTENTLVNWGDGSYEFNDSSISKSTFNSKLSGFGSSGTALSFYWNTSSNRSSVLS